MAASTTPSLSTGNRWTGVRVLGPRPHMASRVFLRGGCPRDQGSAESNTCPGGRSGWDGVTGEQGL